MTEAVVDLEEYEAFVQGHPKGHFAQSAHWAAMKPDWDWQARVCRDAEGNIRGSIAVLLRKLPLGLGTFAYAPRGPICDPGDAATMAELLEAAADLARRRGAAVLRMDPDAPEGDLTVSSVLFGLGFRPKTGRNTDQIQPAFVYRLPLRGRTEEELLLSFRQKTRYNIRLARRRGVEVRVYGEEGVPAFAALMEETGRRDGFLIRPAAYYAGLLRSFGPDARLYMAYDGETPLAGALALRYAERTWYLYGASADHGREKMPCYLLQWEMIRWAKESGCSVYDFRGVSAGYGENRPLPGLCRFKSGFSGALIQLMPEQDLILRPGRYALLRTALKLRGVLLRRKCSKLTKQGTSDKIK